MKRFYFIVNPTKPHQNIYRNYVIKIILSLFHKQLMPLFTFKNVKVKVFLKGINSPLMKQRLTREILVTSKVITYDNYALFYLDLERKLHSYPNLKMNWSEVEYLESN